ncbi:thioesterase II family protein [Actinomadura viridis]|uniref:Surfactin synthase thioesterase subunit n=1 Tax=Actinomadura viridis TaxID=58110 RepID=A0A931GS84_9ACTN|nr:alpha/beta fold hydrolase [Actinomadura viridis]MBG6090544.1 surfactin synthase thioesterase subunit [Actinomadura viridis]
MTDRRRSTALSRAPRRSPGRIRLVCMPFAGGGSHAYDDWIRLLPPAVDAQTVRLPGRETRFGEEPPGHLGRLAADVAAELVPHLGDDLTIFGHSMGALLAFEVVRELRRGEGRLPACLIVSGMRGPQDAAAARKYTTMTDAELEDDVRRMYGGDAPVLAQRDLWELMLPVLRADLKMCDDYVYTPEPPLDCPIVAYGSLDDRDVDEELLGGWREQTTGTFEHRMFPGEHFYFTHWPEAFAMDIARRLDRHAAGPASAERR